MSTELTKINEEILNGELKASPKRIAQYLHPSLVFRRANGVIVDKKTYLDQVKQMKYFVLRKTDEKLIPLTETSACTLIDIEAKGERPDGTKFEGTFRNARFFRLAKEQWTMYAWHNVALNNKLANPEETRVEVGSSSSFSGTVLLHKISGTALPAVGKWQQVIFHPGSRTNWHIHLTSQDLIVLAGRALVVIRNEKGEEERQQLKTGDQIRIIPGLFHWHGADTGGYMVHLAHNDYSPVIETTFWFNVVSEEHYNDTNLKSVILN